MDERKELTDRASEAETMRLERPFAARRGRTPAARIVYRSNARLDTGALERAAYEIKRLRRREVELEGEVLKARAACHDLAAAQRTLEKVLKGVTTGAELRRQFPGTARVWA